MTPLYEKLKQAGRYVFDLDIDMQIINAHRQGIPFVGAARIDMPLYRCHFFENDIGICSLGYLTPREFNMLQKIFKERGFKPYISYYMLYESRVVDEGDIDAAKLAHALYHFHHRVTNRYILQDYAAGLFYE